MFWRIREGMIDLTGIALRFEAVRGILDERSRRLVAAAESAAIGRGGASAVCRATGMSRQVIRQGMAELRQAGIHPPGRVRRPGGGRKKTVAQDPSLVRDLEGLVEPVTRGAPESPLRGTCKSLRKLAQELRQMGHQTSHQLVGRMLHDLDTVCKPTAKRWRERTTRIAMPSLSTSMVKSNANSSGISHFGGHQKERVGGRFQEPWAGIAPAGRSGEGARAGLHHSGVGASQSLRDLRYRPQHRWGKRGRGSRYGAFAVESIRGWWNSMGRAVYPRAARLLITADSGGSNGARVRLWKVELQKLADETGLRIAVRHLPPGTSQWNKIEHRLFSFISQNWRGKPLISHEVIVNLIAATTTAAGLTVHSELDSGTYPSGVKVSDHQITAMDLRRDKFHGDWNYTLHPRRH